MSAAATADNDDVSNDDTDESKPKALKGSAAAATKKPKDAATEKHEPKTKKKTATTKKKASPKKKVAKGAESSSSENDNSDDEKPKAKAKKKATPKKRKSNSTTSSSSDSEDDNNSTTSKKKKTTKKKASPKKKKAKAADHQRWTERTPLTRLWNPETAMTSNGSYTFTVISWNVAGLRAFIKKQPDALANLAERYQADVICLQEHKLQDVHLDDPKLKIREHFEEKLGGFESHWSYSTTKKGYSGTAMFIRKRGGGGGGDDDASKKGKKQAKIGAFFTSKNKEDGGATTGDSIGDIPVSNLQPMNVMTELGLPKHDGEGRTVTAEFPLFYLTNVYVPNSGQKLDRLGYRTEEWDTDFLNKMQEFEKGKPVIWLGDLNVAHNEKDTWNEGAKHLVKSAGTTPQERASFDRQLGAGFVDAFRHLHQDAMGHYSYWSQRAGNREPNKGLRLDYFICSKDLMEDGDGRRVVVRDSYIVPDELGSDHCPIVLEIEMKK
eukprot:CAMPEP_0201721110 /NCGR_PEP_ID=MMETSP0593-20130828/5869_1 /ASSEMBLY_ACC=CAM_ASM_000672 /TAXON_ID=267983 /ORGANISM="Skeletonema japonicum, Strain CCMP2506" /LENGTH=493 /DNA_ID=CAMNT_0048211855 /DNA_START=258 /DNA_END=1739 /DNA_ORIENTATION=-